MELPVMLTHLYRISPCFVQCMMIASMPDHLRAGDEYGGVMFFVQALSTFFICSPWCIYDVCFDTYNDITNDVFSKIE